MWLPHDMIHKKWVAASKPQAFGKPSTSRCTTIGMWLTHVMIHKKWVAAPKPQALGMVVNVSAFFGHEFRPKAMVVGNKN